MKRGAPSKFDGFWSVFLTFVLGIFGAMLLMHWSVCEQDDRVCAITGNAGK